MKRSYDTIALFYDRLVKLVYGKALINARSYLITTIPPGCSILIVGGGTGWEVEELSRIYPSGLTITYIDVSVKMITLASQRNIAENRVKFIAASIEIAHLSGSYDIILTPFLFDNFSDESTQQIFSKLDNHISPGGLWLYCDFLNTNIYWQKMLLKSMYLFFRWLCNIAATRLPDVETIFVKHDYKIIRQKFFLHKFITAIIYKKDL